MKAAVVQLKMMFGFEDSQGLLMAQSKHAEG
jgi:hypothetical protein